MQKVSESSTARPYTTAEVAALFNAHPVTVSKWAADGLIPSFRTPGGRLRYPRDRIDELTHKTA